MDLSHSRPHRTFERAPEKPFRKFASAVERVLANCVDNRLPNRGPAPSLRIGDARDLPLSDGSVDLVLTSPPYLNAIDYIRCSKFSLVWMGYSIADLRSLRTNSVGSEASNNSALDDAGVARIINLLELTPRLDGRHEGILARYVDDMRSAINEVGRVLTRGGRAVYVIGENSLRGTYIRTSTIIRKLAESVGLTLVERLIRTLPSSRRYMPPPASGYCGGNIEARIRRELVLTFVKQ